MNERRARQRFPIELPIRWRKLRWDIQPGEPQEHHGGRSIDISSYGVHVAFFGPRPPIHCLIEGFIDWPVALDGSTALQLRVRGRVVRETPEGFVVEFERHEFCTKKGTAAVA
jgi:hypothetical protein